jgi:predicted transcriptional regulator
MPVIPSHGADIPRIFLQNHFINHSSFYRATKVLRSCAVARKTQLTATDGGQEYTYFKVFCRECRTELGALDAEQVYHFFDVIPGY